MPAATARAPAPPLVLLPSPLLLLLLRSVALPLLCLRGLTA
jgi:hypothetical protein